MSAYSEQDVEKVLIPLQDVEEKMMGKYREILGYLDTDRITCSNDVEVLQQYYTAVITDPSTGRISQQRREDFLSAVLICIKAYQLLIPHNEKARAIRKEIRYIERLAGVVRKNMENRQYITETDRRGIGDDVDRYIEAEKIIPLFGNDINSVRAISILDASFVQEADRKVNKNALIDHISAIIHEEMKTLRKKNPLLAESVYEKLEQLLRRYEEGAISSAQIMKQLVQCAKEMEESDRDINGLKLNDTQRAIYRALLKDGKRIKDAEVKKHIDEIIRLVKKDITIDWLSNENIKSSVRVHLKDYLLGIMGFKHADALQTTDNLFKQIEVIFADYCPTRR